MCREIEDLIAMCETCRNFKTNNPREPLISHELPHRPWEQVGVDLFELKGEDYLIPVDITVTVSFEKFIALSALFQQL